MVRLLIISASVPYAGNLPLDAINAGLGASNSGLRVSFLFEGSGVLQLERNMPSVQLANYSLEKRLKSLELFDITDIYYCIESFHAHKLSTENLLISHSKALCEARKRDLISSHSYILRL